MTNASSEQKQFNQIVHIPVNGIKLEGALVIPSNAQGVVLFAHGSGSSRHSPRNNFVAEVLQGAGMGTLLMDLLTARDDAASKKLGFLSGTASSASRRSGRWESFSTRAPSTRSWSATTTSGAKGSGPLTSAAFPLFSR